MRLDVVLRIFNYSYFVYLVVCGHIAITAKEVFYERQG